jgi:hypothetical protein
MTRQFDIGFKQAKNYSRNFKPRQRGCPMQERTVPFLITAAGSRAEMCRADVRGLNVEYVPIRENGRLAFLEWSELLDEAERMQPARMLPVRSKCWSLMPPVSSFRTFTQRLMMFRRCVRKTTVKSFCSTRSSRMGGVARKIALKVLALKPGCAWGWCRRYCA